MSNLEALKNEIVETVKAANDIPSLEEVRVSALGKKGKITDMMKSLGKLEPEERKKMGQELNLLKNEISSEIDARAVILKEVELNKRLAAETIDITLSPRPFEQGAIHPISKTMEELFSIFS